MLVWGHNEEVWGLLSHSHHIQIDRETILLDTVCAASPDSDTKDTITVQTKEAEEARTKAHTLILEWVAHAPTQSNNRHTTTLKENLIS